MIRRRLILSMIPILFGLGGLLVSRLFEDMFLRVGLMAFSVAVPVFTAGHLLARHRTSLRERIFIFLGVLLLVVGAAFSVSGITESLAMAERVTPMVGNLSRGIGLFSLFLGLFAVLLSVIRTGEDIEAIGERFWHLAEHITEGFILSATDGSILLVNKQFLAMSGLREEEVVGKNAMELAKRLDVQPMQEHLRRRARGIASEYEVTWVIRGEERRYWFSGSPIFDKQGRHTANLATVRDMTEHHQLSRRVEKYAESLQEIVEEQTRQLRRSEERFRQLLLSMNEGFMTIDEDNRIVFANERIVQMLELEEGTLIGQTIFDFVDSADRLRFLNMLARASTTGDPEARQEISLVTREGLVFPAMVAVSFIPDPPEGQPVHSLVVTSVATLKAMQHQLEIRARELERVNEELRLHDRAKDAFLSNVSHELRTPLSTIQGYVEMIESGDLGPVEPAQENALKVMERNIQRLLGLINEMIDFSRMEIRGVQLNVDLFSPARLVQECAASALPGAKAKDITLQIECGEEEGYCWGDGQRLGQVLGILLNNAIKFTPKGGEVRVKYGFEGESGISLTVSDTGIGIDPAYHDKVFDKFFQVDSSQTRHFEGTGIGLSIAKSIVEAHNGHITLYSHSGEGTVFTVSLPGARLGAGDAMAVGDNLQGVRILVADDSDAFGKGLGSLLRNWGAAVELSAAGYQCVRALDRFQADLILLNDSGSDPAGVTTISLLRESPSLQELPVFVATSESPGRLREAGERWRGCHFILKPFGAAILLERLLSVLDHAEVAGDPLFSHSTASMETDRAQVLIIDSDPGFLEWAEDALHRRHIPCCCAPTLDKALQVVDQESPDVIFLNWDEPDGRAEEQLKFLQIHPQTRSARIFIMTGMPSISEGPEGSAGLLRKPFGIDVFAETIEASKERRDATQAADLLG